MKATEQTNNIKKAICAAGGGAKGIALPKLVEQMQEKNQYDFYSGTSVGALTMALFAIGKTPEEIEVISNKALDYLKEDKVEKGSLQSHCRLLDNKLELKISILLLIVPLTAILVLALVLKNMIILILAAIAGGIFSILIFRKRYQIFKSRIELRSENFKFALKEELGNIKLGHMHKKFDKNFGCYAVKKKETKSIINSWFRKGYDSAELVYFCSLNKEHKDIKLIDVVLASAALPCVLSPVEITINGETDKYFDGGLRDNTGYNSKMLEAASTDIIEYKTNTGILETSLQNKIKNSISNIIVPSNRSLIEHREEAKKQTIHDNHNQHFSCPAEGLSTTSFKKANKNKGFLENLCEFYSETTYEIKKQDIKKVTYKDKLELSESEGFRFKKTRSRKVLISIKLLISAAIISVVISKINLLDKFLIGNHLAIQILLGLAIFYTATQIFKKIDRASKLDLAILLCTTGMLIAGYPTYPIMKINGFSERHMIAMITGILAFVIAYCYFKIPSETYQIAAKPESFNVTPSNMSAIFAKQALVENSEPPAYGK